MQLWTDKYRPVKPEGLAGQSQAVEQVKAFLASWKQGTGLIIFGPPGTGKTLVVELLAKERGDFLVQMDASDTRTAKEVQGTLSEASKQKTLFHRGKLILMDEVDSMSGRSDRGGAGGIVKIISESRFPVIVCVNDMQNPKLKALKKVCKRVNFDKIEKREMSAFLGKIAKSEGLKVSDAVLDGLARWSGGDVRSAVLDLQMLSLGTKEITEDMLTSVGFRERKKVMEEVLLALMRTPSLNANRGTVRAADADPDDIFLWLESNLYRTTTDQTFLSDAYDKLSKADIFRGRVSNQQNWRFKAYMIDIMSGIASLRNGEFTKPAEMRLPDRIMLLARSKFRRAVTDPIVEKIGQNYHCSRKVASSDYMPFLMFMAKKGMGVPEELELSPEEVDALRKY